MPHDPESQPTGFSPLGIGRFLSVSSPGVLLDAQDKLLLHTKQALVSGSVLVGVARHEALHGFFHGFFTANVRASSEPMQLIWETNFVQAAKVYVSYTLPANDPWSQSATDELNRFKGLRGNWDAEGASPFARTTLDSARAVLQKVTDLCRNSGIQTRPAIVPLPDGSIRFEWANGDKELFLTVRKKEVEAQRWQPFNSVRSVGYKSIRPNQVDSELSWLAG